ncbi:MAG: hypothetical protein HQL65_06250 [Magnetococcales bacterium]|nr:hypothetical protein [Magnetococcales bacterium]
MRSRIFYQRLLRIVVPWLWSALVAGGTGLCFAADQDAVAAFLHRHWSRPIPAQGPPPERFTPAESDVMNPAGCGLCHVTQYADWQLSHHRRALGPGILGQLLDMPADAREDHQACLRCHAPLAEQADALVAILTKNEKKGMDGLTCAGCHVRGHVYYGPPARSPSAMAKELLPHGGWTTATAFEDARFCAGCHQFSAEDPALNGKLLENTFEEWRQSRYAKAGQPCQACHMPDRRHSWRGIHDPEMVRSGLTIQVERLTPARPDEVAVRIVLRNTGVGHSFPTYVTPRVLVETWQKDSSNQIVPETSQEMVISRDVSLDLAEERFDTRIPPDGQAVLEYRQPLKSQATLLAWQVRVEPDYFYKLFYEAVLKAGSNPRGDALLRSAYHQAANSPYILFSGEIPLATP